MKPSIFLKEIEFSDGTKVSLNNKDITIIVGPNNSGKSATLKELNRLTNKNTYKGVVVNDYPLEKVGSHEDLKTYLSENSIVDTKSSAIPYYKGFNYNIYEGLIIGQWSNTNTLESLHPVFVNILSTEERLTISNPPSQIALTKDAFKHPIHFLQKDDSIELKFSKYFKEAFDEDLIVHRNAGKEVPLHVGKRPTPKSGQDRTSIDYIRDLEKLPLLQDQGDGMRSFVGVLLSAFIAEYNILFIDEPEAFLHPPQARLLGKMLAKDLPDNKQLFLATHSSDFLKGLLDADVENLRIIRLERSGSLNNASILNNAEIKEVWSDSLLRHSNILDGLFHSQVIICESDSDCRFYSAVLQSLFEKESKIAPDVLFIHCGGKHRVGIVQKALSKLSVKMKVVVDFDILNDSNPLKDIYEKSGGEWSSIKDDWQKVKRSIDEKRPELESEEVKREIEAILAEIDDRIFPKSESKKIQNVLKKSSAWSHAKQVGKSFVPSGDPTVSYQRLIN